MVNITGNNTAKSYTVESARPAANNFRTGSPANVELQRVWPKHVDSISGMKERSPEMRNALNKLSLSEIFKIDKAVSFEKVHPLKKCGFATINKLMDIASDKDISTRMQNFFAAYDHSDVQKTLMGNPNLKLEARKTLALNKRLTHDSGVQLALAKDPDQGVRKALATNSNLIDKAGKILSQDNDLTVRILAAGTQALKKRT